MTGRELAAALVERGLDAAAGADKAALFDVVLGAFRGHTGELPRHTWWVPGRLEVFGKHTDYAGGRTLVCAVPNGLAVAASPRTDGSIHVVDARRGDRLVLRRLERGGFTGWRHYVEVAARRLAANFPGAALGADIVFSSDLPRASGMSSSSALVALGGLFLLSGLGAVVGLALWKRRDDLVIDEAFGVLPQHLEEGSPDMPQPGEEPDTAPLAMHMLESAPAAVLPPEPVVAPGPEPEPVEAHAENGNGTPPAFHREEVEAELQRVLAEAGLDAQLEGILSDARELAAEQGLALDSDVILQAICDELNGTAALSESRRTDLRTMFKNIIAEEAREAEQVSQPAS